MNCQRCHCHNPDHVMFGHWCDVRFRIQQEIKAANRAATIRRLVESMCRLTGELLDKAALESLERGSLEEENKALRHEVNALRSQLGNSAFRHDQS